MADSLEALTVEKLNMAVSRAVNAAFQQSRPAQIQRSANTLPGTISIPTSIPSSAPLLYSFNVNTQPPVMAVCKQAASLPIGTLIPVRRQPAVVQLTPLPSNQAVDHHWPLQVDRNLPILLPKQPQNVTLPTIQFPSHMPKLTGIPVVTNYPNQPPQHAGTLILPGNRPLNLQSAGPTAQGTVGIGGSTQFAVNTTLPNALKDLSFMSPPSVRKLQLLPLSQIERLSTQLPGDMTIVQQKVPMNVTQIVSMDAPPVSTSSFERLDLSATKATADAEEEQAAQSAEHLLTDHIGEDTLNAAMEMSNRLDEHLVENVAQHGIDGNESGDQRNSVSEEETLSQAFDTSTDTIADDLKTLVNMVKYNENNRTEVPEHSDKENIIAAAFDMVEEDEETNQRQNSETLTVKTTTRPLAEATQSRTSTSDGLYCVMCNAMLQGQCEVHSQPMVHISDSPILSYARASLPKVLELKTSKLNENKTGVFTKERLAENTRFGPVIGESYSNEEFEKSSWSPEEFWLVFDNNGQCMHMIYTANEETANWMRFVQQAKSSQQQNIVAFQQGGDIYFITNKDVEPNTELLYWFSKDTASFMGLLPTPEECLTCEICQKEFTGDKSLKQHMKFKHPDMTARKFPCQLCDKAFSSACKLNTHVQGHEGIRPHGCSTCGKTFTDKSNLRMHQSIHTGERKFMCSLCNKTFRQKAHLESHKLTHTKEKKATCRFCQKAFARQSDVNQHEFLHTKETIFTCPDPKCNKEFYTRQNLRKHERIHTGNKKFGCKFCCKAFYTKYHVKRHEKGCVRAKS